MKYLSELSVKISILEDIMEFLKDLLDFLRNRKKYWLLPAIITLLVVSILIVFTGGTAIAPFVYTLF